MDARKILNHQWKPIFPRFPCIGTFVANEVRLRSQFHSAWAHDLALLRSVRYGQAFLV
jgi:hypothetical protein